MLDMILNEISDMFKNKQIVALIALTLLFNTCNNSHAMDQGSNTPQKTAGEVYAEEFTQNYLLFLKKISGVEKNLVEQEINQKTVEGKNIPTELTEAKESAQEEIKSIDTRLNSTDADEKCLIN